MATPRRRRRQEEVCMVTSRTSSNDLIQRIDNCAAEISSSTRSPIRAWCRVAMRPRRQPCFGRRNFSIRESPRRTSTTAFLYFFCIFRRRFRTVSAEWKFGNGRSGGARIDGQLAPAPVLKIAALVARSPSQRLGRSRIRLADDGRGHAARKLSLARALHIGRTRSTILTMAPAMRPR
jgi:hypothetical protein